MYESDFKVYDHIHRFNPYREALITLYYDARNNVFIDDDGKIRFDIFDFITPNDLYLFKKQQQWTLCDHAHDKRLVVELHWPDDDMDWMQ